MATAKDVENALLDLIADDGVRRELEELTASSFRAVPFCQTGLLTRDNGILLTLGGGDEFQITIIQSKHAPPAPCIVCGAYGGHDEGCAVEGEEDA